MKNDNPLTPALIRLGVALGIFAVSAGLFLNSRSSRDQYDVQVVPPTCTQVGYSLYTHKDDGSVLMENYVPATGHSFGDWGEQPSDDGVSTWERSRTCKVCGHQESQLCYPELGIARLALEGDLDGIGKRTAVEVTADFCGEGMEFTAWATLKHQGHESLQFDKKNYTLKFFEDPQRTDKYKLAFSHWNPEHKYILKANYIDPSQSRNLICADIWADMAASRDSTRGKLKTLSNYGAVDGFPIALYINGQYQGLYTMNLHKDDDLFGMAEGRKEAILVTNNSATQEAFFRAEATFGENSPWEVEFCGTQDQQWAKDKLNDLIRFVRESDDETFRARLGEHLDVDSAIDYLLAIYVLGLKDNGSASVVLVTYGQSSPWIASLFDMNTAFGLSQDGTSVLEPEEFLPRLGEEGWDSQTGSLLWDRVLDQFQPELRARYQALRKEILTPEGLCSRVEAYGAQIPGELYQADGELWTHPLDLDHTAQITQYINRRIELLDSILNEKE